MVQYSTCIAWFCRENSTSKFKNKQLKKIFFLNNSYLKKNRIKEDLQGHQLIGDNEDCRISLFNLVFSGIAIPYLHNNNNYYDKDGKPLVN